MATQTTLRGYFDVLLRRPNNRGWQLNQEIVELEAELEMKLVYHRELQQKFQALLRQEPEITDRFLRTRVRVQAITHHVEELQMKLQRLRVRARSIDCCERNEVMNLFR